MEYILRDREDGCFLCRLIQEEDDRENLVLKRGKHCFVVMNRYPYNNGHLMVCPYHHIDDLEKLKPEAFEELSLFTVLGIQALRSLMHPHGFNVGINLGEAAGAGLKEHIHQHIVPRWNGDTNFMPVVGNTKIIPQDLFELYDQLLPLFANDEA
jgi:ATP adenylyltransferase